MPSARCRNLVWSISSLICLVGLVPLPRLAALLEEAAREEVAVKRAIDDCHQVSRLHGEERLPKMLAGKFG